ncbi:hypothetical protein HID58_017085 [Brassica napus]|uniref:Uncharacterized protein n=1 Tax=Brassica napus TaxID=3708 RepID=A0ABQ8D636_BRANA|nr:hypothetical protein HID58_017085 [Brassica napus]
MQFLLPEMYKKAEDAPRPTDERVVIKAAGGRNYGVVMFSHMVLFIWILYQEIYNFNTHQNKKRIGRTLKMAEEQQKTGQSNGENIIPPEEVAKFLPETVEEGGWEKCWEDGITPWDQGRATPLVVHLVDSSSLPLGRALVPGCGGGHDVVAMASPERFVVGLDISESALAKAAETYGSSPKAKYFTFVKEDFFTWRPNELFDLIFDYVVFCAIEPEMRPAWAKSMYELLKPDGELITLMYPITDHDGGPPYKVAVSTFSYEDVLVPVGFKAVSIEENPYSIATRKGKEKLGRWKKIT